jgi:DEAD/DEAH box helicase domain-containing protein
MHTHENVGWGKIHLDEDTFHTTAYWLALSPAVAEALPRSQLEAGLIGLAHVLGQVAPLYLMCDPHDIAVWPEVKAPLTGAPTIFMYDHVPGGIGLSKRLYGLHRRLLGNAGQLVSRCGCERGCPSCIGPSDVPGQNPKMCVLQILSLLMEPTSGPPATRETVG